MVRMDTSAYVWSVPATRTKANRERTGSPSWCLLRTRKCIGRLAPLGIYIMSLVTDPIRGNRRPDPNTTSSPTLMSRSLNVKLLINRHLSHDDPTVWVTTRTKDPHLSDPATYYSF